jgi:AcrR family transcriptional regulator
MATTRTPPTPRGQARREKLLVAAAKLVATHGFHAVGVSDIGAAAGVSGAALYRHFDNKTDILVALFDRFVDGLLLGAAEAIDGTDRPERALVTLIAAHAEVAVRDRAILAVYAQEAHILPTDDRRRLRRKQRQYVEIWRTLLHQVHPGLTDAQALLRVEGTFGLLNSVPNLSRSLSDRDLERELSQMAADALQLPSA